MPFLPNTAFLWRPLFVLLSCWVLTAGTAAGQAQLTIPDKEHAFGKLDRDGGQVSHAFTLKSTGNEALQIERVEASCGCTAPRYPREPIAAGATGELEVVFDPEKQSSGRFSKTVTIHTNDPQRPKQVVRISGEIKPKKLSLTERYPYKVGNLRLATTLLRIDPLYSDSTYVKRIDVRNTSDQPITLQRAETPRHAFVRFDPLVVPAQGFAELIVVLQGPRATFTGLNMDELRIITDDPAGDTLEISALVRIKKRRMSASEAQARGAPVIRFEEPNFNFGKKTSGYELKHRFYFTNKGKENLRILTTDAECGCTIAEISDRLVPPGARSYIAVTLDTRGKRGRLKKQIEVFTNDPAHPTKTLTVRAEIE